MKINGDVVISGLCFLCIVRIVRVVVGDHCDTFLCPMVANVRDAEEVTNVTGVFGQTFFTTVVVQQLTCYTHHVPVKDWVLFDFIETVDKEVVVTYSKGEVTEVVPLVQADGLDSPLVV